MKPIGVACFLLSSIPLLGQDSRGRESFRQTEWFPTRIETEQSDDGFFGAVNPSLVFFSLPSFKDNYEVGQIYNLEAGYYWEVRQGMFLSAGIFFGVLGNSANTINAPPVEKFDLDIFTYGVVGRFGHSNWPGYHFGLSGGLGRVQLDQTISNSVGTTLSKTSFSGNMFRLGVFLERDLFSFPTAGVLLGITGDFYQSDADDGFGRPINFWTAGVRLTLALKHGPKPPAEPRSPLE